MSVKLTPAQKKALTWIADNEPVSSFPVNEAPALSFVSRLERLGLVERVGKAAGMWGFTKFGLTEKARSLLKPSDGGA